MALREQGVVQAVEEVAPPSVPMDLSQAKKEGKVRGVGLYIYI